jgi:hypothetical protein
MKSDATDCISSPDEFDPYFPYVAEQTGIIDIIAANSQLECFRMFRRFPDVSDKEHSVYCEIKWDVKPWKR